MKEKSNKKRKFKIRYVIIPVVTLVAIASIVIITIQKDKKEKMKYQGILDTYFNGISSCDSAVVRSAKGYSDSYIFKELEYPILSGMKSVVKNIMSSVSIEYDYDDKNDVIVGSETLIHLSYISYESLYNSIKSDYKEIRKGAKGLREGTARDYNVLREYLSEILAEYSNTYTVNTIDVYVPIEENTYIDVETGESKKVKGVSDDFDIYLDELLFNSDELHSVFDLLSAILNKTELLEWSDIQNGSRYENTEDFSQLLLYTDLGSYYKSISGISTYSGSGTFESPAEIDKNIETLYIKGDKQYPVYVHIDNVMIGEDAVEYVNGKHVDNRGITSSSSLKLVVVQYTVINLTDTKIKIKNKLALSDSLGNLSVDNGVLYGLKTSGTLKPLGSITLEYYTFTENPESKYLVWGSDFKKNYPYVWFNCLQY